MKKRKYLLFISIFIVILITLIFARYKITSNADLLIISSPDNKTINYYEYNFFGKTYKKIYSIDKTCYPTATLSKDNRILYFTKSDKNKLVQLFQRNLGTNEEKQLTSQDGNNIINVDFLKINYNDNLIYLRVVQENHRNFNLAIYNIKSNEVKILDNNETDLSNQFFDFTNYSNSILTLQNSEQEKYNLMAEANKSKKIGDSPNNNIVLKDEDGKDEKVYDSLKSNIVDVSISPDKQSAIILIGEVVNPSERKFKKEILLKDLNINNEPKSILDTGESFQDIEKICFSKDGKGFYFVANELNNRQYNIYYYDLNNKTTSLVSNIDNENVLDCIVIGK